MSYNSYAMIEHALWVTTDRFEAKTPGADFINPICFGQDFAVWLQSRLAEQGLVVSEPIQEDWGWVILVSSTGRKFTVNIGVMDESRGQVDPPRRRGSNECNGRISVSFIDNLRLMRAVSL